MESIVTMLDELAEIRAAADVARLSRDAARDLVLAPVREALNAVEMEFAPQIAAAQDRATEIEALVKSAVVRHGASIKGTSLQAVYSKPRVSWDTKALDGYAVAHPELLGLRTEGQPSVSIRAR